MGQQFVRGAKITPSITQWEICKWNIARLELELGIIDAWPDDVPKALPMLPYWTGR